VSKPTPPPEKLTLLAEIPPLPPPPTALTCTLAEVISDVLPAEPSTISLMSKQI
jgi:hypothetical protein